MMTVECKWANECEEESCAGCFNYQEVAYEDSGTDAMDKQITDARMEEDCCDICDGYLGNCSCEFDKRLRRSEDF